MNVVISRKYQEKETLGSLYAFDENAVVFTCATIELPNKGNQHNISCIPEGKYEVVKHISPTKGRCFHILNVPNRSNILIHVGNYATGYQVDTEGCILVGDRYGDINNDGQLDVLNSKVTLGRMLARLPDKFDLYVF